MKLTPSPFAPAAFPVLPEVKGVRAATGSRGFYAKRGVTRDDVFLFVFDPGTTCAGVYTVSRTASADVLWCREALEEGKGQARALVANSGNSNAFTGPKGREKNEATLKAMSETLGVPKQQCFLAATGVIGEPLADPNFVGSIVPELAARLGPPDWEAATRAFMTTDTFAKASGTTLDLDGTAVSFAGIVKGSGMIAPNMATMLAYVFTDAAIAPDVLQEVLTEVTDETFNCITVDGDTSTSDTLMVFATVAFVAGKWKYVHIPPAGERIVREVLQKETLKILARLCVIFVFVSMFFALFYQSQSAWVLQAEKMNLRWLGVNWLPAQVQFVNSFYIILMIPLFSYVIYPALNRVFPLTPLRKIGIGMFVTALCFVVPAWVENRIAEGLAPSIGWQFFAYVLLTAGEILASIPVLEFAYTQAPKKLKTFVMSLYLLAISLGNVFSALVNHFIQNEDGSSKLPGASYYWFFAGAMLVTLVLYIPVAMLYPVKEYIQDEKA